MNNRNTYAHGWYSQPGELHLTQESRPARSNTTALAPYLPKGASSSPKVSSRGDVDIRYAQQVSRKWATSTNFLQTEPVELGKSIEYGTSTQAQPFVGAMTSPASTVLP